MVVLLLDEATLVGDRCMGSFRVCVMGFPTSASQRAVNDVRYMYVYLNVMRGLNNEVKA